MPESNVKSGFKACGIYPFNPAIPSDAYLPNFLYSVESLLQNTTLRTDGFGILQQNFIIEPQGTV